MTRLSFGIPVAIAAILLLAGCYGAQMVRGPIYTEETYTRVDSLLDENRRMNILVADLREQLMEEREARLRYEAQMGVTLRELEESVRVLASRMEERGPLQSSGADVRRSYPPPVSPRVQPYDGASSPADSAAARGEAAADELYRASYLDVTRGNYSLAIQGFQNYLVRFPAGAHLSEVHYYLGESYYAGDRHLEAVGEFQYVVREFPESRLVPAAYLKSGLCYVRLDERNLAQKAFSELINRFPDTEEAQQARAELDRIGG